MSLSQHVVMAQLSNCSWCKCTHHYTAPTSQDLWIIFSEYSVNIQWIFCSLEIMSGQGKRCWCGWEIKSKAAMVRWQEGLTKKRETDWWGGEGGEYENGKQLLHLVPRISYGMGGGELVPDIEMVKKTSEFPARRMLDALYFKGHLQVVFSSGGASSLCNSATPGRWEGGRCRLVQGSHMPAMCSCLPAWRGAFRSSSDQHRCHLLHFYQDHLHHHRLTAGRTAPPNTWLNG